MNKATGYQVGTDDTGYFKYITNPEGQKLIEGIPRDLTNFAYELRNALTEEVAGYKDALKLANENIGTLQEQVGNLHRNYATEYDTLRAERDALRKALEGHMKLIEDMSKDGVEVRFEFAERIIKLLREARALLTPVTP